MQFSLSVLFRLLALFSTLLCDVLGVIVQVKQGFVSGTTQSLQNGKVVDKFIHIPYALPPVGKRRFKDPEPIKVWSGVWNATNDDGDLIKCIQYMHVPGGPNKVGGQEDCLYLSVYTPKVPQPGDGSKLLDVIVYIHGGAFIFGTGFRYIPFPLLERHNLVYVELNYRLGPLGFLSTGDVVVPGNMGLKDQTQALRWVHENIAQFGGNPNSVTIAGMSAGGASVHFQMLSQEAKGLFHRAISMSGTMLNPWTIAENLPEKTKLIANHLGCPVQCSEKMIECLRNRPASFIANAVGLTQPFMFNPFSPWGPTVDNFANHPVLPDYPANLIRQGRVTDVPWLTSVTTAEGLYPAAEFLVSDEAMKYIDENWTEVAPHILDFNFTIPHDLKSKAAEKIRHKYLGDKPINRENQRDFVKIISDRMFYVDAEKSARFQCKVSKSPVYFYEFNYRGRYSLSNHYARSLDDFGVSHGDDTQYIISIGVADLLTDTLELEQKTMDFMTDLWASFASTGKMTRSFVVSLLLLGAATLIQAQVPGFGGCPDFVAMPDFDMNKFLGTWYETERYVNIFEVGSRCVKTNYTKAVDGRFLVASEIGSRFTGVKRVLEGEIKLIVKGTKSELNVRYPNLPIPYDTKYTVLDTNYDEFAVVWSCSSLGIVNTQNAWILTREQLPSGTALQKAYGVLDKYKLSRYFFSKTDQNDCYIAVAANENTVDGNDSVDNNDAVEQNAEGVYKSADASASSVASPEASPVASPEASPVAIPVASPEVHADASPVPVAAPVAAAIPVADAAASSVVEASPVPVAAASPEEPAAPQKYEAPVDASQKIEAPAAIPAVLAEAAPSVDAIKADHPVSENFVVSAVETRHKEQPAVGSPVKETIVQSAPLPKSQGHAHHATSSHHNVHNLHHHHAIHHSKVSNKN